MIRHYHTGFTLIELLVVIVLIGILAVGAGMLISRPIESYNDQLRRQQLVDSAEMALRKIATDIRRALPNSVRVVDNGPTGWALEMVNTVDGARYRDEAGGIFNTANDVLDFASVDTDFNVLGRFSTLAIGPLDPSYRAVIYNTSPAGIYSDASANNNPGIISPPGLTLSLNNGEHHLAMSSPFQFSFQSPGQRVFLVDGPVSYVCDSATASLTRFEGYAYQLNHADIDSLGELSALASVNEGRVASQVSGCVIDYQPGSSQRGGLITLELTLSDAENESIRLLHQVHVDNVP